MGAVPRGQSRSVSARWSGARRPYRTMALRAMHSSAGGTGSGWGAVHFVARVLVFGNRTSGARRSGLWIRAVDLGCRFGLSIRAVQPGSGTGLTGLQVVRVPSASVGVLAVLKLRNRMPQESEHRLLPPKFSLLKWSISWQLESRISDKWRLQSRGRGHFDLDRYRLHPP